VAIKRVRERVPPGKTAPCPVSQPPLPLDAGKLPIGYVSLDKNGRVLDVNPKWQEILAYSRAEVRGRWFGDFVAFEMAQQLISAGEEVSLLVLIDPAAPPGVSRNARYYVGRIGYFRRRGNLLPAALRYTWWRIIEFRRLWIRGLLANAPARRLARAQRVHRRAQNAYRVKPYPGEITFLGAEADYHPEDNRALWECLALAGFHLQLIPGSHRSMTHEPNLDAFVSRLEQLIRDADRAATS
jgi:thioesterase domain-containing protein